MDSWSPEALDEWLVGDEARAWLVEVAADGAPTHQRIARLRKHLSAEQARRVTQLVELRQRAAQKFPAAGNMFFTRVGLEQATDHWIAEYKARRLPHGCRVADLCCGIGGDAMSLAKSAGELVLCDRSATMTCFALRNVRVAGSDLPGKLRPVIDDVSAVDVNSVDAWHIDPDRRPAGRRTTQAELHEPSDAIIDRLLAANPNAAVKLAPACEVPPRWQAASELEWIGRDGECKQLVAWQGNLTDRPGMRRATMLHADGEAVQVVRTLTGSESVALPAGDTPGRYVFEPHAAVLASGLTATLATQHGWWGFARTAGYLSGDQPTREPAAATFEIEDILPLNTKKLARYLRERGVGQVEIKHRAVALQPETLRRDLKLSGERSATLLITRQGERRIAIVARRLPPSDSQ